MMTDDELAALAQRCIHDRLPVIELVHALAKRRRTMTVDVLFGEGAGTFSGRLKELEADAGRAVQERAREEGRWSPQADAAPDAGFSEEP